MYVAGFADTPEVPGPYPGIVHHFLANAEKGFPQFEVIYSTTEKGNIGANHSHPHSAHMQLVLEGSLKIVTPGGKSYDVPAGSAVFIQPGEEHEVVNTYDGTTKYLVVLAPPR
jgi:quercetin dioxygenase-like cupin family protein